MKQYNIQTIGDLQRATPEEVQLALRDVTVLDDLERYISWLNSPRGRSTEGTFKVGFKHRSKGIHPSVIAKKNVCPLKVYFDSTGEVDARSKITTDLYQIFDIGTAVHSMMQMHFNNMYEEQFEEEVKLTNEPLLIKSSTDGIFSFSNLRIILEMKTIKEGGEYGFEKVQLKPFEDNLRQTIAYMGLADVPFGLILYVCKNNGKKKEHPVVFDPKIWQEIVNFAAPIADAVRGKAPKPMGKSGPHCKDCDYLHGCEAGKRTQSGEKQKRRSFRIG